ncbi:MAG: MFS transporter [Tractidigestivibacter sp.]|uniref:MFS transporter n=1 Tax=Tractidigestivibacter sp. TaxID=2847320 RepID=UPI003D945E94
MGTIQKKQGEGERSSVARSILLVALACVVFGVQQGIHDNYGIMMTGLLGPTGLSYSDISFCIGVGALIYGFAQPFMGMLAIRTSHRFVLILGTVLMATGLLLTPLCRSFVTLLLCFGIVLPLGTTGLALGILMSAITPIIGERRAAAASGLVQAAAGIGDALMSPTLESLISSFGIQPAMSVFAIPLLLFIPIAIWIGAMSRRYTKPEEVEQVKNETMTSMIKGALKDRDYRLVTMAFATCGFNMSIIESHLFSQFVSWGIPSQTASYIMTVYGIFTMIGATATGFLCTRFRTNRVLGTVYAIRVVVSVAMLLLPKTVALALVTTALLGCSGDATVPPTTSVITKRFGATRMAVLYGFATVGHQIGAFFSSYLGGVFVDLGLGYAPLWIMNMCLATFAAASSYRIGTQAK